jgi:predicted secreted hydrolase
MRASIVLLLLCCVVLAGSGTARDDEVWQKAAPGYAWDMARDLSLHPDYKTEWWYITGHLFAEDAPEQEPFGFQLTFFRSGLVRADTLAAVTAWDPVDLVMGHAAVSDPVAGEHSFSEIIRRTTPFLGGFGAPGEPVLAWCRAPAGTDARWELAHRDGVFFLVVRDDAVGLRYELECRPTRAPVFHGEEGYSPKSADGSAGSLYFSQTRMATTGTLYRQGKAVAVQGESWLDREIFTSTLSASQKGWDWVSLRLDDGSDLMLYQLRDAQGDVDFALGTEVESNGSTRQMPASAWSLEPQSHWISPATGSRYPVSWKLVFSDGRNPLRLEAAFPEQENVSEATGIHYWEGAVTVHPGGQPETLLGRGFVELTGYGEGSRPPI